MGLDIHIMDGKEYSRNKDNEIFHATYTAANSFKNQSPAFKELISLAGKNYPCIVAPEKYSSLITKFEVERAELERQGNTVRGINIDFNAITIYDCVEGCHKGLQRALMLGKNIRIH
jgi:hypothetical protein